MKKKIGELYNKPIVIGNKNEVTKNEVHIDELSSNSEEGNKLNYSSDSQDDLALLFNKLHYLVEEKGEYSNIQDLGITLDGETLYEVSNLHRTYSGVIMMNYRDSKGYSYGIALGVLGQWFINDNNVS
jgi:hypothetical protein